MAIIVCGLNRVEISNTDLRVQVYRALYKARGLEITDLESDVWTLVLRWLSIMYGIR